MSTDPPHNLNAPTKTKGGPHDAINFRSVPITFHTDEDTALRLTNLASQAGVEISWYIWRLISDAYIDYLLVNGQEP